MNGRREKKEGRNMPRETVEAEFEKCSREHG